MRGFIAVVQREIAERWFLPVLSFALGVVAVLIALLPSFSVGEPEALWSAAAMAVAAILGGAILVIVGSSILCRDWTSGRIAFYLARPIRPWQLVLGKMAALLVLLALVVTLAFLPASLVGGKPWVELGQLVSSMPSIDIPEADTWWDYTSIYSKVVSEEVFYARYYKDRIHSTPGYWLPLMGAVVLLYLSHFAGVVLILRGTTGAVDLAAGATVAGLLLASLGRLREARADEGVLFILASSTLLLLIVAPLAIWAQVRYGGSDPHRAHWAFSRVFWAPLLLGALMTAGATYGTLSSSVEDLKKVDALKVAPGGAPWVVSGPVDRWSGYRPTFAVLPASPGSERSVIPLGPRRGIPWPSLTFSADGGTLAWARAPWDGDYELWSLDFTAPSSEPTNLGIGLPVKRWSHLALEAGGQRVAIGTQVPSNDQAESTGDALLLTTNRVEIYGLSPRSYASVEGAEGRRLEALRFADGNLWIYRQPTREHPEMVVLRWTGADDGDLRTIPEGCSLQRTNVDGELMVLRCSSSVLVTDRTGETVLAEIPLNMWGRVAVTFLEDGGLALLIPEGFGSKLVVLGADGAQRWSRDLEQGGFLGDEDGSGNLWLGLRDQSRAFNEKPRVPSRAIRRWASHRLDLETGETLESFAGYVPSWHVPEGGPGPGWLIDDTGQPHRLDPESGELVAVDLTGASGR